MVPDSMRDFFIASGGAAAALVGLLFVAISVSLERLQEAHKSAQLHRIRASASLTAFTNALAMSLLALVPKHTIGATAVVLGIVGLLFVIASLMSLIRVRQVRWSTAREALFLIALCAVFLLQVIDGVRILNNPGDSGDVSTIAILVVACFLIGIARAWELIGAPSIGIRQEVRAVVRDRGKGQREGAQSAASGDEAEP